MKILYYDVFSGISGDMNLGALIDLGVPKEYLISEINKLKLCNIEIIIKLGTKMGINGYSFEVLEKHCHEEEHKANMHLCDDRASNHDHKHNSYKEIKMLIESSLLKEEDKDLSIKIFDVIAKAEGKIHNADKDEVHFHEVGAVDSIIDIVGAAICINYLNPSKIISSPIEIGRGFVRCQHGNYPVPAPAVAEILKGIPVVSENVAFEATTPTGAAILKTICNDFTYNKNFKIIKTGYGIGKKDGDIPNVLRVFMAEIDPNKGEKIEQDLVLECNIDDMNPEGFEYLFSELFKIPVYDATIIPVIMKKGRPAFILQVILKEELLEMVESVIFKNSTTIGLRYYKVDRKKLHREVYKVLTKYGEITLKEAYHNGQLVNIKPEYEDIKKAAMLYDVSINTIYQEAIRKGKE